MQFEIWRPHGLIYPRPDTGQDHLLSSDKKSGDGSGTTSLAAVKMRAQLACEHADALLAAADAARRAGTWQAPGAASLADYKKLADAEAITGPRLNPHFGKLARDERANHAGLPIEHSSVVGRIIDVR